MADLPTIPFNLIDIDDKVIVVPTNAPPAQKLALNYAITFHLTPENDDVKWVEANHDKYQELLDIKNALCKNNGLNPDKYLIKLHDFGVPAAAITIESEAENLYRRMLGKSYSEFNPLDNHELLFDKRNFLPPFDRDDREAMIAHEIGHTHRRDNIEVERAIAHQAKEDTYSWFRPRKETMQEEENEKSRRDESLGDYEGSVFMGGNIQKMTNWLAKVAMLTNVVDTVSGKTMGELNQEEGLDHPTVKARIAALVEHQLSIQGDAENVRAAVYPSADYIDPSKIGDYMQRLEGCYNTNNISASLINTNSPSYVPGVKPVKGTDLQKN